jgi:tRNA uracil 4-sulfurtransferase
VDRFFVIHYNELGLKKGNRDYFENALCANINTAVESCGVERARRISGRVLLPLKPDADTREIQKRLSRVFGIAYFAEAWASSQAVENLETNAWGLVEGRSFNSFRIEARRSDKRFPLTSVEINQRVGAYVKERTQARVDLENPELTCWIEIVEKYALIYVERFPGPGG